MTGENSSDRHLPTVSHRKRLWLIALGVGLLLVIAGLLLVTGIGWDRRSADERLAEIEAARAIPDAENAALIYDRLLQDPNATAVLENPSDSLVEEIYTRRTLYEPWLSRDHPELAAWLTQHQFIIDGLMEACRLEKCRFPVVIDIANTSPITRVAPMRRWGFLLSLAANNDLAEGRIDAALTKWRCVLQMANHLRQQPALLDHILANSVERSAMGPMSRFAVTGTPTESCLQKIEAMPLPLQDHWAEYERQARLIDNLVLQRVQEQVDRSEYIRHPIQSFRGFRVARAIRSLTAYPSQFDDAGRLYRQNTATARGIRILVALRRVRNTTGRWPAGLDEIGASLPEEILTDPLNQSSFVYKPAADMFRLYSRGPNNMDEGGKWDPDAGSDDWPIWPPRGIVSPGSTDGETP
jgi:hypothetical protein